MSDCKNFEWQAGFTGRGLGKLSIAQAVSLPSTHCGWARPEEPGEQTPSSGATAKLGCSAGAAHPPQQRTQKSILKLGFWVGGSHQSVQFMTEKLS